MVGGGVGFEPRRGEESRASPRSPPDPSIAPLSCLRDRIGIGLPSLDASRQGRRVEGRNSLDWRARRIHFSWMKKASITETKNNLSALIDGLRGGSPVLIVDRGRPVARLEPVTGREESGQNGRLSRLVRDGVLRSRRT